MSPIQTVDTIIIGGGPAGSTAAHLLSKAGQNVVLLDKNTFPRKKLCAGLLTWKTLGLLQEIFTADKQTLLDGNIIHGQSTDYAIHSQKDLLFHGSLSFPFHFVDRMYYDHYWLNKAKQSGAAILTGERLLSLDPEQCEVVTDKDRRIRARWIIAADGANSRTRNILARQGLIKTKWRKNVATALEVFLPKEDHDLPDYPVLYFGYVPWGYAWSFPGPEKHVLGMCALSRKVGPEISFIFQQFLADLKIKGPIRLKGHPLPYGNYLRQPGNHTVLLAGDACGLADPLLGEGIYYAHRSGQMAASAILETLSSPTQTLATYKSLLSTPVYREMAYAKMWRNLTFGLLSMGNYRLLKSFIRLIPERLEETIQGFRSFCWLKRIHAVNPEQATHESEGKNL